MVWWLLVACVVNEGGPAAPGSASADALQEVSGLIEQVRKIEALAKQLEAMTDQAREAEPGTARQEQVSKMRALMDQIAQENAALQASVQAMESGLHEAAGDPTWLPAEAEE